MEAPSGDILAACAGPPIIVRIDPITGEQTVVSDHGMFQILHAITTDLDGNILVTDISADAVFRVDPVTGEQSTVSQAGLLESPVGIAVDTNGDIYVSDDGTDMILRIDPITGLQTVVSMDGFFQGLRDLAIDASGDLLVTEYGSIFNGVDGGEFVIRVNAVMGDQEIVSQRFQKPQGIAIISGSNDVPASSPLSQVVLLVILMTVSWAILRPKWGTRHPT